MADRHRLSRSARQHARRHKSGLITLYCELPEPFKMREAKALVDWDNGTFLKLKKAGLLDNEYGDRQEPKDWSLSHQAKRWIEAELD